MITEHKATAETGVQFADLSAEEEALVWKIVRRAAKMLKKRRRKLDGLSLYMDIAATRAQAPLDLKRLYEFSDFDFAHDVFGIMRHMNRRTGKLADFFLPRAARPYYQSLAQE